jgi:hypothetical protein
MKHQKEKEGPQPRKSYKSSGIFSHPKDDWDEDGQPRLKRTKGRAQTADNLWNYIKGKGFNHGHAPTANVEKNEAETPEPVPGSSSRARAVKTEVKAEVKTEVKMESDDPPYYY